MRRERLSTIISLSGKGPVKNKLKGVRGRKRNVFLWGHRRGRSSRGLRELRKSIRGKKGEELFSRKEKRGQFWVKGAAAGARGQPEGGNAGGLFADRCKRGGTIGGEKEEKEGLRGGGGGVHQFLRKGRNRRRRWRAGKRLQKRRKKGGEGACVGREKRVGILFLEALRGKDEESRGRES